MAGKPDRLTNKIKQLLQITLVDDNNAQADERQQADQRLQALSVKTTSGDTLVIVRFPTGDFVDCDRQKVFFFRLIVLPAHPPFSS